MPLVPHIPAGEAQDHAALIVALDAQDLAGADLARAEHLVSSCDGCAALATDLAAIRGAMVALPAPVRSRDYRLTPQDAARLQPSAWQRVLHWLAAPGSTVRPLATGLATLGVVGLLLTAGIPRFGGATALDTVGAPADGFRASGAQTQDAGQSSAPAAVPVSGATARPPAAGAPAPNAAAGAPSAAPAELNPGTVAGDSASAAPGGEGNATSVAPEFAAGEPPAGEKAAGEQIAGEGPAPDAGIPVGVIASAALLLGGLGLFLARALVRRRTA